MTEEKKARCAGCGKALDEKAVQYRVMKVSGEKMHEWGQLHEACFRRLLISPADVLAELRRQSQEIE